jgi:hypothetical protein
VHDEDRRAISDDAGRCTGGAREVQPTRTEAVEMELLIERFEDLSEDGVAAFGAVGGEFGLVVLLAIRQVIVLMELRVFERLSAISADEVFGMPRLVQSADVLTLNHLITVSALRTIRQTRTQRSAAQQRTANSAVSAPFQWSNAAEALAAVSLT